MGWLLELTHLCRLVPALPIGKDKQPEKLWANTLCVGLFLLTKQHPHFIFVGMIPLEFTEDELVLLIQLALPRMVEAERLKPTEQGEPLPLLNTVLLKLHQAHHAYQYRAVALSVAPKQQTSPESHQE